MRTVCKLNNCNGCYACIEKCPKAAISIVDDMESINATIDNSECIDCHLCEKVCPNNNQVKLISPMEWHQGWALNEKIRNSSSSGGLASEIMRSFCNLGGYVCTCKFQNGSFSFILTKTAEDLINTNGSKYVKSTPKKIYHQINELLKNNEKVLFIGLPCQVAGVIKYNEKNNLSNLFTVDLICHGSPSAKLLDKFLEQYDDSIATCVEIGFRSKYPFDSAKKRYCALGSMDCYSLSFIYGLSYTRNCYKCNYASIKRCADITLGDSWGSKLPFEERKKGISLVLCQTDKGKFLLSISDLRLENVDINIAIKNNHQLERPMPIPKGRTKFFEMIKSGETFNKAISKSLPRVYYKQCLKEFLIKLKVKKLGEGGTIFCLLAKIIDDK